jgi:dCTP deaminase
MILSAATLRELAIVSPFVGTKQIHAPTGLSYGCSVSSYDIRLRQDCTLSPCFLPGSFRLLSTVEHFRLPNNVAGRVHNKSTIARLNVDAARTTFIDPGFVGYLTLEVINNSWRWVTLHAGQPIAQVVFEFTDRDTEGYDGKYQHQEDRPIPARRR